MNKHSLAEKGATEMFTEAQRASMRTWGESHAADGGPEYWSVFHGLATNWAWAELGREPTMGEQECIAEYIADGCTDAKSKSRAGGQR